MYSSDDDRAALLEATVVWALIVGYIWLGRRAAAGLWMLPLAVVLISHRWRGETWRSLGFSFARTGAALRQFGPWAALWAAFLVACGAFWHSFRPLSLRSAAASLALYCAWGLFQQYVLNGYFLNRLEWLGPRSAPLACGVAFSLVHAPNWFLMAVTLVGGIAAAMVYQRHRDLWFIGIVHGVLGFLIYLVVPDSISHHLWVGPKYWTGIGGPG